MNIWLCIWFGEPIFGYLYFNRYFLPKDYRVKIHFGVLLDTEPVSGSGSPIHNLWFGPILAADMAPYSDLHMTIGYSDSLMLLTLKFF